MADEATEKRVRELIHRLETESADSRYKLIREIRNEAAPGSKHPPIVSSDRTDLLPVLEAAPGNEDDRVRQEAIWTLSYMKCKEAFPIFEKAFESPHPHVRLYACMGTEWLGDVEELRPRVVAALERARDREGELLSVRASAASGLASLGFMQEAKLFLELLRHPRGNEALAASELARLGRKDAIELMIVRLRTAVPSGDYWVSEALKTLTGEDLGKDADAWQKWLDANRADLPEQLK